MARFAKRHLDSGARVLDLGCGVGANAMWLASEGYVVEAIDVSDAACDQFKKRIMQHGNGWTHITPKVASATAIPFRERLFDAVIDVCVLQHLVPDDVVPALQEIWRVLQPGGEIFSVIAAPEHSMAAFPEGVYTRLWTVGDLCAFNDAGFSIEWCGKSTYEDEKYDIISHWLVRARK